MQQKHIDVMHTLNNCAFSALQITNKKLKGVIAIKAVFPQLSPHNRAEEKRNNYKSREGTLFLQKGYVKFYFSVPVEHMM